MSIAVLHSRILDAKRYRGQISSPSRIRRVAGIYWGYNVRLARSLSDALKTDPPYDLILGTSERGVPIEKVHLPTAKKRSLLMRLLFYPKESFRILFDFKFRTFLNMQ